VRQDQRYTPAVARSLMDEVDVCLIEASTKVRELIEAALMRGPVELFGPSKRAVAGGGQGRCLAASRSRYLVGPTGVDRSILLGSAAIVMISFRPTVQGLLKDHVVAVLM
jgi:hypothetical protein